MAVPMIRPSKHPTTGTYRLRKRVPDELRFAAGVSEWIENLRTKDSSEAKRRAPDAYARIEAKHALALASLQSPSSSPFTQPAHVDDAMIRDEVAAALPSAPSQRPLRATELLQAWEAERNPAAATLKKYQTTFRHISRILGFDDVQRITPADVVKYKKARVEAGLNPGTISDDVLAAGAVCRWAKTNLYLDTNPFAGLAPKVLKRGPAPVVPFDSNETALILEASRAEHGWLRWAPWLLCFTGARVSEFAEMRRGDIREVQGVWILI